jgi:hypothetical protein
LLAEASSKLCSQFCAWARHCGICACVVTTAADKRIEHGAVAQSFGQGALIECRGILTPQKETEYSLRQRTSCGLQNSGGAFG